MPEKTALITGSDPSMTKHTEHVRALDVEGAYNVRDLGGYETRDGRMTRWGEYLRSDTLANLSPAGVNTLLELRHPKHHRPAPQQRPAIQAEPLHWQ